MSESIESVCPECNETVQQSDAVDRRDFLRAVGTGAAALAVTTVLPTVAPSLLPAVAQAPAPAAPAGASQTG